MKIKKYFYKASDFFNEDKKARYIKETLDKGVLLNASGLGNFYGSCYVRL
jgi:hypothetical protein